MVLTLIMSPDVYIIIGIRHGAICLMVSVSLVVVCHTSVAERFQDAIHVHCTLQEYSLHYVKEQPIEYLFVHL